MTDYKQGFKVGDLVKLISGGPRMAVETTAAEHHGGLVGCVWFYEGRLERTHFHQATLVPYKTQ